MLIPHECHKPAFQIDGPIMQTCSVHLQGRVPATKKGYGTKQHEEKSFKRKRRFRLLDEDATEFSDEAMQEEECSAEFAALLCGLEEAF